MIPVSMLRRIVAAATIIAAPLGAQSRLASATSSAAINATYVNTSAIRVDGILSEPFWHAARPATAFTQHEPVDGAAPTRPVDVRMIITDEAVFIGAHMAEDPATMKQVAGNAALPSLSTGDYFEVQIDPHAEHLTALAFAISPVGVKESWMIARDGRRDDSWKLHWDAATHLENDGWSVEIRIPLSEFHVAPGSERWAAQFVRFSFARQETDVFSSAPRMKASRQ